MKIILISGKAEAGKTLTANILKGIFESEQKKCAIVPYGAYVKDTARLIFGWDGKKDEYGRNLLQTWGTEMVRSKNPYFWINTVRRLVSVLPDDFEYVIIDDCRFINEIECWDGMDAIRVRVERPGHENALTPEQRKHISETELDDYKFDVYLRATDTKSLEKQVREVLMPCLE